MYPNLPAGSPDLPPRQPVTYSRHSTSARTRHGLGVAVSDADNEARGEAAFDRISHGARGTHGGRARFRAAARAATKAANRPHTAGAQSKQGALTQPSIYSGKDKEKSDTLHRPETRSSINDEEDDIAEAVARSLGKKVGDPNVTSPLSSTPGDQDDSNIAEAKIMSLLSNEKPAKHAATGHSYKSIGSVSASTSTAPHTVLHSLLDTMESDAKAMEEADPVKLATAGPKLARIIRGWHDTMTRVIYATEAAEHKRIQYVQAQLDYDRVVEDKHKNEMDTLSRQVGAQMLQMQQNHHQVLKEQKQAYNNLLAKQVAKPSAPTAQDRQPGAEPALPRIAKSPSPHLQDKIDGLTSEITTLKSEHETKVAKIQASHADQVRILHRKAERLADANALLRIQETSKKEKMKEMDAMKQNYEGQLQEMKEEAEKLAKQNARLEQQIPPTPPFIFRAGGQGFPQSARSDPGLSSKEGSENWSRKRARRH